MLSTWLAKISLSFLFTRLTQESDKLRLGCTLSVLIAIFGTISLLSVALRLDAAEPWLYRRGDAKAIMVRWIVMGAICVLTDVVITVLPGCLVWNLNMASKHKSLVTTAFALRFFVTPITIARLIISSRTQHDDLFFTYSLPEVMTQLDTYCNLVSTTLPCLRVFLTAWNTNFMDVRLERIDQSAYKQRK